MESSEELEGIGGRIRQWRKNQGLKAYELAQKLKISNGSLSEIENGKSLPSALTLAAIHQNTDLNVGYVLTGQIEQSKAPQTLIVEVDEDVYHVILKKKRGS